MDDSTEATTRHRTHTRGRLCESVTRARRTQASIVRFHEIARSSESRSCDFIFFRKLGHFLLAPPPWVLSATDDRAISKSHDRDRHRSCDFEKRTLSPGPHPLRRLKSTHRTSLYHGHSSARHRKRPRSRRRAKTYALQRSIHRSRRQEHPPRRASRCEPSDGSDERVGNANISLQRRAPTRCRDRRASGCVVNDDEVARSGRKRLS